MNQSSRVANTKVGRLTEAGLGELIAEGGIRPRRRIWRGSSHTAQCKKLRGKDERERRNHGDIYRGRAGEVSRLGPLVKHLINFLNLIRISIWLSTYKFET